MTDNAIFPGMTEGDRERAKTLALKVPDGREVTYLAVDDNLMVTMARNLNGAYQIMIMGALPASQVVSVTIAGAYKPVDFAECRNLTHDQLVERFQDGLEARHFYPADTVSAAALFGMLGIL